jgi:hypothetical protein
MKSQPSARKRKFGATFKTVSLARHFNWPAGQIAGRWWKELPEHVGDYPQGPQTAWGVPFQMGRKRRAILVAKGKAEVATPLTGRADYICLLHEWRQLSETLRPEDPT